MLLMGLMRNVAITGSADTINAWAGQRQGGRWAAQTAGAAMPTVASHRRKQALEGLEDLRKRGIVDSAEYERLRARVLSGSG